MHLNMFEFYYTITNYNQIVKIPKIRITKKDCYNCQIYAFKNIQKMQTEPAYSSELDETAPAQSDLGLHCLSRPVCLNT